MDKKIRRQAGHPCRRESCLPGLTFLVGGEAVRSAPWTCSSTDPSKPLNGQAKSCERRDLPRTTHEQATVERQNTSNREKNNSREFTVSVEHSQWPPRFIPSIFSDTATIIRTHTVLPDIPFRIRWDERTSISRTAEEVDGANQYLYIYIYMSPREHQLFEPCY